MSALGAVEAELDAIQARLLPAMRTATAARDLRAARASSQELSASLARIDPQLAWLRRWAVAAGRAGALGLIAPLEAAREACRAEAAPLLALAPPPAPTIPVAAAFDPLDPSLDAYLAADEANVAAWEAKLDAAELPDNVIDARDRFGEPATPVQLLGAPALASADVHAHAAAGIAGAATALPHLDAVQASFGAHDVTGIRAHVGGAATHAAAAIGAEAYATGDDVAFATAPSLFVAAHEAAHVVQQRAGVSLLGGVGASGDTYEKQADAVAQKVVRGESAERLLGPARSSMNGQAVQRKEHGSDEAVNDRRANEGTDQSAGGRRSEVAPEPAERDRARAERRKIMGVDDQLRPLLFAELVARKTLDDLRGEDLTIAMESGFAGCEAITFHLQQVTAAPELGVPRLAELSGLVFQIAARMDRLGLGSGEVLKMLEATALVQALFPEGAVPTIEDEAQAEQVARHPLPGVVTAASLLAKSMRTIVFDLDLAVEAFRSTAIRTMEDDSKESVIGGTVSAVMGQLQYVAATVAHNDVGADLGDRELRDAVAELRVVAQRFLYCAMYEPALPAPATKLEAAMAPLMDAFGLPALVVEHGGPAAGIEANAVEANGQALRDQWVAIYEAQHSALQRLSDQPDSAPASSGGWDQLVLTLLATASFNWALGLVAGAASTELEGEVTGDRIHKGAVKTASADVVKGLAKGVFDAKLSPTVTSPEGARIQFFHEQQLALVDLETRHLEELEHREIQDAKESPEGRAALAQQKADTEPAGAQIAEVYAAKAVQDWALHLAVQAYGEDQHTGGANLDQVGEITGDREDPGHHGRGVGVLEIIVELGDAFIMPKVVRSVVEGLSDADAGHLSKLRIGELQLPVQIRAYADRPLLELDHAEGKFKTQPASFLISRNREGTVWLSAASEGGSAWLTDYAERSSAGADPLRGATALFEAFAGEVVGAVEGG